MQFIETPYIKIAVVDDIFLLDIETPCSQAEPRR